VTQRTWLLQRALLALLLMVSFYVLALGIAAALLWIPYEAYVNDVHLPAKIALICIGLAATIIWSILPRIDRFVPPGPPITSEEAPQLFAVLAGVAESTAQEMPAHVYLVSDVNAFVTQRGGVMGIGGRRVMGIGLPLMQSLTVQELRAVVAHEFGHYHAGDVKIGPWIHKTRAAIGRTIQRLSNSILQRIFVAYANLFLRTTLAVSRRQEFIADEVAANTAGATSMASALRKVHGAALAFHHYWRAEVSPLLNSGYLPPLSDGFARFTNVASVQANVARAIVAAEADDHADPYNSHPPLRARLAALQSLPPGSEQDTRPAVSLLADPARWERDILAASVNAEWARSLKPVRWEAVVDTVYIPMWREAVRQNRLLLAGESPGHPSFAGRLSPDGSLSEGDDSVLNQMHLFNLGVSLLLLDAGWTAVTAPGEQIAFRLDGEEIRPFDEVMAVATGKVSAGQWAARWTALGGPATFEHLK
jgi:heat shock protein HtpX